MFASFESSVLFLGAGPGRAFGSSERAPNFSNLSPDRRVEHGRADDRDDAGDQRRIDVDRRSYFLADGLLESRFELFAFRRTERSGRTDFGVSDAARSI